MDKSKNNAELELTNLAGLARRLHVSQSWLRREIRAGGIPYLKAGCKKLSNPQAVQLTLAERAARGDKQGE